MKNTIEINGKKYDRNKLSDNAKEHIRIIAFVDAAITRYEGLLAVHTKSRLGYAESLKKEVIAAKSGIDLQVRTENAQD